MFGSLLERFAVLIRRGDQAGYVVVELDREGHRFMVCLFCKGVNERIVGRE